jgi:histone acetyltransferase (RNA polymerase elongator complex component)
MSPKRRIIPLFIPHLGCPNDCVFCNQKHISGNIEPVKAEDVRSTILSISKESTSNEAYELAFYGGSFTAIPAHEQNELLGAVLPFLREGIISSIRVSTRPDAITAETLSRLEAYGVKTIELGAQSMIDRVLAASGRGHTAEDTSAASDMIKSAALTLFCR